MSHTIVREFLSELDERGFPKTKQGPGVKIECVVCGQRGYAPSLLRHSIEGSWLRKCLEHVECSCGAIITKAGFHMHVTMTERSERRRM